MNKVQVLARLKERHARFAAIPSDQQDRSIREAVLRTLDALDRPDSYYVVLSADEREQARAEWQALSARAGKMPAKARTGYQRPDFKLPPPILAFFGDADSLPYFPRASDDCEKGMQRVSWKRAQDLRYIELNPPAHIHWLVFDCDHHEVDRWKSKGLPEPSFITVSPGSGRHHVAYRLRDPVCRSEQARHRPLAYLRAVQLAMRDALGGDLSYAGVLTKNPLHSTWATIRPERLPVYSLAELAATVDLRREKHGWKGGLSRSAVEKLVGLGQGSRNRALFDAVRARPPMHGDIHGYAHWCNTLLAEPLHADEVSNIVKSIERYEASGRRASYKAAFSARQSARGRKGGRPRTVGDSQPWVAAGVSRSTWYRHQVASPATAAPDCGKQPVGRPITTKDSRPWEGLGMSRATWYRRQQASSSIETW